jgi:hypothetical protein
MRILIAAAAIALAAYAVLTSVPAHADPTCSYVFDPTTGNTTRKCENYTGPQAQNTPTVPVCAPGGLGGRSCTDCTQKLASEHVDDGDALTQSWWDCGMNGGRPAVTNKPHCYIDGVPTGQPPDKCYGNYVPDGHGAKTVAAA